MKREVTVAGVDVGGPRKGFHAVALTEKGFIPRAFSHTTDVAAWCRELGAAAVGVDAPCGWSASGKSRRAERDLRINSERIHCFNTPTEDRARQSQTGFYDWVFNGMTLYAELGKHYTLFDGDGSVRPLCFETFPQAVACALAGRKVPAKRKATVRREILSGLGYDHSMLKNIDFIDAALCAVAARRLLQETVVHFGQADEGFIVIPAG
jgi:predicted nuclease with RNAse H fold